MGWYRLACPFLRSAGLLVGGPLVFQVPLVGWHDVQADFDGPAVGGPSSVGDVIDALVRRHLQELGLIGRRRPDGDFLGDSDLREAKLSEAADDPARA